MVLDMRNVEKNNGFSMFFQEHASDHMSSHVDHPQLIAIKTLDGRNILSNKRFSKIAEAYFR